MIKSFLDSIKVYDVGLTKTRVGNKNDGGYVILEEICKTTKGIYSYGIGDDIGFEKDFVDRFGGMPVKLYDPTIEGNIEGLDEYGFEFHKEGIGADWPVPSGFIKDSLLKIDVEYCEWASIEQFDKKELAKFSQIVIELHIIPIQGMDEWNYTPYFKQFHQSVQDKINRRLFARYSEGIKKLTESFYIYHIHANNSLPKVRVNDFSYPPLLELSLVRKDLVSDVKPDWTDYPIEGLDYPNKTDRPDITSVYPLGS